MEYLKISPEAELIFQVAAGSSSVRQTMNLTNMVDQSIAFKVKTTAPRLFSVRPSSGVLEKKQILSVLVMLQTKDEIDYKRKEKFLIQCIKIPAKYENLDPDQMSLKISELWTQSEQNSTAVNKDLDILQKKLKCVVLPPSSEDASLSLKPAQESVREGFFITAETSANADAFGFKPTIPAISESLSKGIDHLIYKTEIHSRHQLSIRYRRIRHCQKIKKPRRKEFPPVNQPSKVISLMHPSKFKHFRQHVTHIK